MELNTYYTKLFTDFVAALSREPIMFGGRAKTHIILSILTSTIFKMLSLDLYIFLKNEVSRKISFVGTRAAQVQQETWPALRSNNKKENIRRAETRKNYVNILPLFRNATNAAECAFRPLTAVCQRFRRGWGRGLVTTPRLREVTGGRSRQPGGRARQEHFLILFSKLEINLSILCTD